VTFAERKISLILFKVEMRRGGSRGTSNCVGGQNTNYLLRKTKLKAVFALLHRYLKSASDAPLQELTCSMGCPGFSLIEITSEYTDSLNVGNSSFTSFTATLNSFKA